MLLHQEGDVLHCDVAVQDSVRLHDCDGSLGAKSLAPGPDHLHLFGEAALGQFKF
jgi:hypothetical protein